MAFYPANTVFVPVSPLVLVLKRLTNWNHAHMRNFRSTNIKHLISRASHRHNYLIWKLLKLP